MTACSKSGDNNPVPDKTGKVEIDSVNALNYANTQLKGKTWDVIAKSFQTQSGVVSVDISQDYYITHMLYENIFLKTDLFFEAAGNVRGNNWHQQIPVNGSYIISVARDNQNNFIPSITLKIAVTNTSTFTEVQKCTSATIDTLLHTYMSFTKDSVINDPDKGSITAQGEFVTYKVRH
ncbi:MAG TPA: hypothetical protein VL576_01375 [Candidatus Paceibacterota bacterium]|jgi:hypothetical protein|nr:hypothetical protein [Candidatus Paceibacterota bacterium]